MTFTPILALWLALLGGPTGSILVNKLTDYRQSQL